MSDRHESPRVPLGRFAAALCLLVFCVLPVCSADTGAQANPDRVGSADIYNKVHQLHTDLEMLRQHMGKPRNEQKDIPVRQAVSREVYYQALALYRNANKLAYEHTREWVDATYMSVDEITPMDVFRVVHSGARSHQACQAQAGYRACPPAACGTEDGSDFDRCLPIDRAGEPPDQPSA